MTCRQARIYFHSGYDQQALPKSEESTHAHSKLNDHNALLSPHQTVLPLLVVKARQLFHPHTVLSAVISLTSSSYPSSAPTLQMEERLVGAQAVERRLENVVEAGNLACGFHAPHGWLS